MREITRTIVSAVIFSQDGKVLMGRKEPKAGGVYADCWHLPGGGLDEGEAFEDGVIREVVEEVGITLSPKQLRRLPEAGSGTAEKTLKDTGETVLCHMEFNLFEVRLDHLADDIVLSLDDDLVETHWFTRKELKDVEQIPGGKEFFIAQGYMDAV